VPLRRLLTSSSVALLTILLVSLPARAGVGFQPVSPDELRMTSEPQAPGAPAIILYRQVDRDDTGNTAHEDSYFRLKILTEEGRKHADIEIPFFKENGNNIVNIRARTIRPDGSIANFDGKVFEKSIAKARGLKYIAKTFTLPDVQVGSIIEYYYTLDLSENVLYDSRWILNDELFTKHAKFSLKPYTLTSSQASVRWSWQQLPPGAGEPKEGPDHIVRLEVNNVPAFKTEDYMPPENELRARVDFTYSFEGFDKDPVQFWKKVGRQRNDSLENFVSKRSAMEEIVGQILSPGDAPEVKLQKIYARVQQLRNTSFEVQKSEQQKKREKEKTASNVEDLWKRGYGNGRDITWLFLALARAAGFEAYGVWVSDRRNYFFYPSSMDSRKLDSNVVLVKLNGKDLYLDPGSAYTPFGMLPWPETGVQGLRLDKNGGTWVQTTVPDSSASRVERHAALALSSSSGDLEGKLTISYIGLEAILRRVEERNEDEADRKKYLEDEAREYIPAACDVELKNKPDWGGSSQDLVAEFDLKVPGWASGAGRRVLLPVGLFGATEKHVFDHAERIHPIYFEFPFQKVDDITITLPEGWQLNSMPPDENQDVKAVGYLLKAENTKQTVHLTRKLRVDLMLVDAQSYQALRDFFQSVRKSDEQQIVLQPGGANASN
jgi:transglutaminase-like putative cysteine protease